MKRALRIFHGPVNIAGIGRHLADWQRERGLVSDFFSFGDAPIVQPAHVDLKLADYGWFTRQLLRAMFFLFSLVRYDLFHFYASRSFFRFNLELPILRLFRKKIVMTYCGSDVRLISVEARRNPYWRLLKIGIDDPRFDNLKKWMMRWHRLWVNRVIAPRNLYASAHEVLPERMIIKDLWIHNTVDINAYEPSSYATKTPPVLVHAPSETGIKGTKFVDAAMEELQKAGLKFEYRRIVGCSHAELQVVLRDEADVIIDQLLLGGFGTLAVEGMYYGKAVVGYLIDSVKGELFPDCPIVNATIDNLTEKLRWLITRTDERVRLGKEGRAFVERHCDREAINQKLLTVYQSL